MLKTARAGIFCNLMRNAAATLKAGRANALSACELPQSTAPHLFRRTVTLVAAIRARVHNLAVRASPKPHQQTRRRAIRTLNTTSRWTSTDTPTKLRARAPSPL